MCRFDNSQEDRDNYKIVERNMKDLYNVALVKSKLKDVLSLDERDSDTRIVGEGGPQEKGNLEARFVELGQESTTAPAVH